MTELIAAEFPESRADGAVIEAANISAEPKRAGIVSIVEDPVLGVALDARCASGLHIELEIIAESAEKNSSPKIKFALHAGKIQE